MIRVAIVDDEREYVEQMAGFFKVYQEQNNTQFICDTYLDGIDLVSENSNVYDIVFLDIDMKLLNGVDTAKKLREYNQQVVIIFLTKLAQYAIRGYEVSAFDFILKPIDYNTFALKMKRILNAVRQAVNDTKIQIRHDGNTIVISARDILYVEVIAHKVIYHTSGGDYEIYGKIKEIERKLAETEFFRCHRAFIVNLKHVTYVGDDEVHIGKHVIPLSRLKKKDLLVALSNYIGANTNVVF